MENLNGVISDLTASKWVSPINNKKISIPIKKIEIATSLDGREFDFVNETHPDEKILIVSDKYTHEALGARIFKNLNGKCSVKEYIWKNPKCSIDGVKQIQQVSKDFSSLIAVGSGTINDSVKYATFLDKNEVGARVLPLQGPAVSQHIVTMRCIINLF